MVVVLGILVVGALIGILVVGSAYRYCCRRKRTARPLIAEAAARPIAGLEHGEWAKVVGRIEALPASSGSLVLRSPLQGRPCVYYAVEVEAFGDGGTESCTVARRRDYCDFGIRDASGALLVLHASDVYAFQLRNIVRVPYPADQMPHECVEFLQGCSTQEATFAESCYYFEEAVIEVGAEVVALGVVVRQPGTGQLTLQSDTAAHLSRRPAEAPDKVGLRQSLQSLDQDEMRQLAAHVVVSDDPGLFGTPLC